MCAISSSQMSLHACMQSASTRRYRCARVFFRSRKVQTVSSVMYASYACFDRDKCLRTIASSWRRRIMLSAFE